MAGTAGNTALKMGRPGDARGDNRMGQTVPSLHMTSLATGS